MRKILRFILTILLLALSLLVVFTPMNSNKQYIFGMAVVAAVFIIGRFKNKKAVLTMLVFSLLMSTRYIWWRATTTLHFDSSVEMVLGSLLFAAEIYSWTILVLGYIQMSWPLKRPIAPMPADQSTWPTVDIYVPTYNESLDVVRDTVLAAQCIEYPKDKVSVYILDDGQRDEFRDFAAEAGVGYIIRSEHSHAKAGNLNHAMTLTRGELICVFDCDHVATRVFLQATVGAFFQDEKLALIQTPHYFYSPDPFERNLTPAKHVPHEGALFYGPVQQGNDNWNATFFCGSCAVIRRDALNEVGGFAVETVTEDAHTALKLQRRGWNTAFLDIPLAAGLATERLALHVNQRIRWARGMTQIFRVDNPMLGRGLKFTQRLCYLNAMLHFQYGLPRVIFLTAPLVFMLFNLNIISSSATLIFSYALPHLILSTYVNSKITGRYRYAFWGEIYETVMAFHLILPTLVTMIAPKLGKFNVTDKGDLLDKDYFDATTVRPLIITALLMVGSMIWVGARYYMGFYTGIDPWVILFNIIWGTFSTITLLASIAVAKETKQVRKTIRITAKLPTRVRFSDGSTMDTHTLDVSMGGARVALVKGHDLAHKNAVMLELGLGGEVAHIPLRTTGTGVGELRMEFDNFSLNERRKLVRVVLSRADAWFKPPHAPDRPIASFLSILQCVWELFFGRKKHANGFNAQMAEVPKTQAEVNDAI
ncbi:cellulose synthase catalytic subunit (UDP-forming) [Mangrovibacter phragmitis]|uniref:Cellulose synthase catalytic subunit [UDP-forming] n=2 Tax=Enterobacterales TaxID=91347 RepID=A0A1B7L3Y2_9ENTR|nr:UDP-forming cellulose synthase catalytic subunit [Mangrovibacter phragmitis]OAT76975.1 cellulose synthase catalytic subunit (UDP-forming) [Mangrovibacter phragmitis]